MSFEVGLVSLFNSNLRTTTLLAERIYPVLLPQDAALPAMSYTVISDLPIYSHHGPVGIRLARVQVDIWSLVSYEEAATIAEAVDMALSGYRGVAAGVKFVAILNTGGNQSNFDIATGLWHRMLEYRVNYGE